MKIKIILGRPFVSIIYFYEFSSKSGRFLSHEFIETKEELHKLIQRKFPHKVTKIEEIISFSRDMN